MALSTGFALVRREKTAKNPEKITAIPRKPQNRAANTGDSPLQTVRGLSPTVDKRAMREPSSTPSQHPRPNQ
jgi:hypothetical protein